MKITNFNISVNDLDEMRDNAISLSVFAHIACHVGNKTGVTGTKETFNALREDPNLRTEYSKSSDTDLKDVYESMLNCNEDPNIKEICISQINVLNNRISNGLNGTSELDKIKI